MARPYHSASSIALVKRCQHAAALQYIAGIREPEVPWAAIESGAAHTSRQRSTALGKAMHTVGERWYAQAPGMAPDWHSLPGEIFLSGAHLLPHPERCHAVHVEQPIGHVPLPALGPGKPTLALDVHGVRWAGFKDLLTSAPGEFIRLKLDCPDGWLLTDYKSTGSIERYALTPDALEVDTQASLYAIDVCLRLRLDEIPARWVYFETKKVRRAAPVDARLTLARALDVLGPLAELAREFDLIERVEDAPKNPLACGDYGGCPHHVTAGGPCDARRSTGALIQARVKRTDTGMAIPANVQAKLDALNAKKAAPAAAPVKAKFTPKVAPAAAEDDEGAEAPEPPAPKTRKPRAPKAEAAPPEAAAPAGSVAEIMADIEAAIAARDEAAAAAAALASQLAEALAQ